MALSDRLASTPQRSPGLPCSVGALQDKLEGPDAEALDAMLHTLGWSARRIYDALTAEGYVVSDQQINRHRSRACRCYKAASA